MRSLLAVLAAVVVGTSGGGASASTAQTQARLAAARPVVTQAVTPPSPPVMPDQPTAGREPMAAPPRPNLPTPEAPASKPAQSHRQGSGIGLVLLFPALLALVAVVRWFARRRRSKSPRV